MAFRADHTPDTVSAPRAPAGRALLLGWGLAAGVSTLVLLASTVQRGVVSAMYPDKRPSLVDFILWPAVYWYTWALLAPFVFLLVRRVYRSTSSWGRRLAALMGGMVLFYAVHVTLQVLSMSLPVFAHIHPDLADTVSFHASRSIYTNAVTYWVLVGVTYAVMYHQRYRQREVEAARLESKLAQAQLQALKMQLHPHFLFNTLHSISALMYRDVHRADRMVGHLGDLLRMTIESEAEQEVPLCEEIALLEKYLQIEQIRFEDRLTVRIDVEPDVETALVPNLVMQPLVENALKHGVGARPAPGCVEVRAWREGERLCLRVRDDGPGLAAGAARNGLGVGLANTRARLDRLYGPHAELRLRPGTPEGLVVDLSLPFHTAQQG